MASNFEFLAEEFPLIYQEITLAEQNTFTAPRYAAMICRSTLEMSLFWLYENDSDFEMPFDKSINSLLHTDSFRENIRASVREELNAVRLLGNIASHAGKGNAVKSIKDTEALHALKCMFNFLYWMAKLYGRRFPADTEFNEELIPHGQLADINAKQVKDLNNSYLEAQKLADEAYKDKQKALLQNQELRRQLEEIQSLLANRKEDREQTIAELPTPPILVSELETRRLLIDLYLREAGWDNLQKPRDVEYEVHGMPLSTNPSGKGYVDYVLWDDNAKPLAIVEAKSTLHDSAKGQHQASLYADCLEKSTGQRPIIFYSNGYETHIWDDQFYPPRQVYGFYNKQELQTLIKRRESRKDIRKFEVNMAIAGRPYQLEAVQRLSEHFVTSKDDSLRGMQRRALLVMATGSGKTRTAATIVDMLTKCNWAKRILFLADRNALVTQAKNAFKEHLPHLSTVDLTKEKETGHTRIVFSTYPTMMNCINNQMEGDNRAYGIGHFDAIFIDEAHRSIYQKYQSIFDYFDGLLIGLTATPKKELDKNTYSFFQLEDDIPTFAYELDTAVADGYLVPPRSYSVPVHMVRDGVKYKDLSDQDKEELEEKLGLTEVSDEELQEFEIGSSQINSFLFNEGTVDLVLDHLMNDGLKVASGDKLGKTIIFARNHRHAVYIEERFNKNYPEYGGHFCRVIDNYNDKAQDLLEKFCYDKEELAPQIAISVDMMDTGVDAPSVLNLVFFKPIKSYAKFWQMVGRGTRLRRDLFGPGENKEYFLLFDYCRNLEFFQENPDGQPASTQRPLSQLLFLEQLNIINLIQESPDANAQDLHLVEEYTDVLHKKIAQLDTARYEVRKHLAAVHLFSNRAKWNSLTKSDILTIETELSHLVPYTDDTDEMAKRFDLNSYKLQVAMINRSPRQTTIIQNFMEIGKRLIKKRNVPAVAAKEVYIREMSSIDFWQEVSLTKVENLRKQIRDIIHLLKEENIVQPIYTKLEDNLMREEIVEYDIIENFKNLQSYKDRVTAFIKKNKHHMVIDKLHKNHPINAFELQQLEQYLIAEALGSKEEFTNEFGDQPLGTFIRSIIGLDQAAIQFYFTNFIAEANLSAKQIKFMDTVIRYFVTNGYLDTADLMEPPFTELDDGGIIGLFDENNVVKLIGLIKQINQNADIGA
ncbi:DEAD/DEAH box helicase family protein [Sphingobacterium kitahiroshimense]|uniref:DEAD/DEAH box helicase family protein n=1 Tax=Sphingobacterium kitahiroshimense TaxID=470446 RepID=UPI0032083FE5